MSEVIRAAAKKWFYQSFDCDLLEKMEKAGLIAQAEGFSVSVMAELELEMESAFSAAQSELAALRKELADCKRSNEILRNQAPSEIYAQRLTAAEQRNSALTKAISDAEYRVDQGKVWNGMGWTYTGLHSHGQQKALDILRAALKPTESGASE